MTQIVHSSYTANGWIWRKRHAGTTIAINLRTKDAGEALERAKRLTVRYIQYKPMKLPVEVLRERLRAYRDDAIDEAFIASVTVGNLTVSQSPLGPNLVSVSQTQNIESDLTSIQDSSKQHSLKMVMDEWIGESSADWKERTISLNRKGAERFLDWCAMNSIQYLEQINKKVVSDYKKWLDKKFTAPRSRQDALVKASGLFTFAVTKRDYIASNPFSGMYYKNLETVNEKEAIPLEVHQKAVAESKDEEVRWLMEVLWHTGMRIGEAIQLTEADYREIDGVKCFSL